MLPLSWLLCAAALAQEAGLPRMDAQLYTPTPDQGGLLWTRDSAVGERGWATAVLGTVWTREPLVVDGDAAALRDIWEVDLAAAASTGRLRMGVELPLVPLATGERVTDGSGVGDLALDAKLGLLDRQHHAFGLALRGRADLPTASVDAPVSPGAASWTVEGVADRAVGPLLVAVNAGSRSVPATPVGDLEWDDHFTWRVGVGWSPTGESGVSVDLAGQLLYWAPQGDARGDPVEILLGGWSRLGAGDLVARLGVGTGLNEAVGAPAVRTVFLLARAPRAAGEATVAPPGDPVAVTVVVRGPDGERVDGARPQVQTAEGFHSGGSSFTYQVPPGTWGIAVRADGYLPLQTRFTVPPGATFRYEPRLEAGPGEARLKVVDALGRPVAAGWSLDGGPLEEAPEGTFELSLDPGEHVLRITAPGFAPHTVPVSLPEGQVESWTVVLQRND